MANTISNEDKRAFRPRARIMRTLGEELISSETVAVLELVKNAYDADAGYVLVRFEKSLAEGEGALCVEDDGHGMSLQVVESAWMEPATNNKKQAKTSQFLKRRLLGEKGVGRFASARLAEDLELSTRAVKSEKEVYAYFDWSQFDNEDTYLDEVLILAEEHDPEVLVIDRQTPEGPTSGCPLLPRDGSHGTSLRMNRLKRTWGDKELEALRRGLSRLISPFDGNQEFKIFFQLPEQLDGMAQELEPPDVIKYPHYTLSGSVDEHGKFVFSVTLHAAGTTEKFSGWLKRSKIGKRPIIESQIDSLSEDEEIIMCGPFSFDILVWDRDQLDNIDQKLGTGIRNIRKDLDSIAGISIFRDSFRVLPYGEPENDWLKLDLRRVQNPTYRLSNNQITGYVRIGADNNPDLRDQSNREGLDNNQPYMDLQDVLRLALTKLETPRYKEKNNKSKTDSGKVDKPSLFKVPDTSALRKKLEGPGSDSETLELFDETTKAWESQITRIREVVSRYHALATMGQLVDKVIHDGRQPLGTIQVQTSLAREIISQKSKLELDLDCKEILGSLDGRLEKVKGAAALIDQLLKRIEPLGGRRKGRPTKVYMNEIIRNAFSHFTQDIEDLGIQVVLPAEDDLVQVDALELQEVFINLISNSIYWLQQVPKTRRSIIVKCSRPAVGEVDIIFADSGPGIPSSNRASIFDPYFTTKPEGVGLGLVIAGEVIRDYYDGNLELLNSGPLPGAVFRIKLRKRV